MRYLNRCYAILMAFIAANCIAATPDFNSFNANQFDTSNSRVAVKNGASITNPVFQLVISSTNLASISNLLYLWSGTVGTGASNLANLKLGTVLSNGTILSGTVTGMNFVGITTITQANGLISVSIPGGGGGTSFTPSQFATNASSQVAIGRFANATNLYNYNQFTNWSIATISCTNDSGIVGVASYDLNFTTNAHLIFANPGGDQTKFVFTFGGVPLGGLRVDNGGSFNWHSGLASYHAFYNDLTPTASAVTIRGGNGSILIGGPGGDSPFGTCHIVGELVMSSIGPPAPIGGTAQLYCDSGEMWALDDSGNATQLTSHTFDAPPELYDAEDPFPHVILERNDYLGILRFTNVSRQTSLLEKLLAGNDMSTIPAPKRKCSIVETYDQYKTRTGKNSFEKREWSKDQVESKKKHELGQNISGKRKLVKYDQKPIPQWLKDRGAK